jgi:mono/diheme cytochrome c family protein
MTKIGALLKAVVTAVAISIMNGPLSFAQDAPPGNVLEGKRLYMTVGCFLCHGRAGQGGALNGPVPSIAKTQMPFEGFRGQLREPANDMPAYTEAVMSEKQIADIYAFVQSLAGPLQSKEMAIFKD